MTKPPIKAIACLLVATATVAWAAPQQISQSGTVDADVDVEVYNVAGSVRISGWDRNEIQVEGSLGEERS